MRYDIPWKELGVEHSSSAANPTCCLSLSPTHCPPLRPARCSTLWLGAPRRSSFDPDGGLHARLFCASLSLWQHLAGRLLRIVSGSLPYANQFRIIKKTLVRGEIGLHIPIDAFLPLRSNFPRQVNFQPYFMCHIRQIYQCFKSNYRKDNCYGMQLPRLFEDFAGTRMYAKYLRATLLRALRAHAFTHSPVAPR